MQKQTTGCTYGRDMLHPTMLELLAYNVAPVCTGLYTLSLDTVG